MKRQELSFDFPEELIATEPQHPPRVLWVGADKAPCEIAFPELLDRLKPEDLLVINETRVLPRRVWGQGPSGELEILFLQEIAPRQWTVLFPSRGLSVGEEILLPGNRKARLIRKGRPQVLEMEEVLTDKYFSEHGEWPLPPYIQKARGDRHNRKEDESWYQTAWARVGGSLAAPTASLHFRNEDMESLRRRGVRIEKLILHVGLGTFLPVTAENLEDHEMHEEFVEVPRSTWEAVLATRERGGTVWALGTTVARALESTARGLLKESPQAFCGGTRLFLHPGAEWRVVNGLLTNFHQPESTLLALVASFCDLSTVQRAYAWAIERRFRLFSYGDLTAWKIWN